MRFEDYKNKQINGGKYGEKFMGKLLMKYTWRGMMFI
jgi:hypothetical protein